MLSRRLKPISHQHIRPRKRRVFTSMVASGISQRKYKGAAPESRPRGHPSWQSVGQGYQGSGVVQDDDDDDDHGRVTQTARALKQRRCASIETTRPSILEFWVKGGGLALSTTMRTTQTTQIGRLACAAKNAAFRVRVKTGFTVCLPSLSPRRVQTRLSLTRCWGFAAGRRWRRGQGRSRGRRPLMSPAPYC